MKNVLNCLIIVKSIDNRLWSRTRDPNLASGGESIFLKNREYRGYQKIK
jgi:hypothetical protein